MKARETADWKKDNPDKVAVQRRSAALRKYGLTIEDYNRMLMEQQGQCAVCGSTESRSRSEHFHVDHDHTTGRVRALLCGPCNVAVGMLQESPDRARKLAEYLEVHLVQLCSPPVQP